MGQGSRWVFKLLRRDYAALGSFPVLQAWLGACLSAVFVQLSREEAANADFLSVERWLTAPGQQRTGVGSEVLPGNERFRRPCRASADKAGSCDSTSIIPPSDDSPLSCSDTGARIQILEPLPCRALLCSRNSFQPLVRARCRLSHGTAKAHRAFAHSSPPPQVWGVGSTSPAESLSRGGRAMILRGWWRCRCRLSSL